MRCSRTTTPDPPHVTPSLPPPSLSPPIPQALPPLPTLPTLPDAPASISSLAAAIQEPARLADAYAAARNTAAAEQWDAAGAAVQGKGSKEAAASSPAAPVHLPPSAAAGRPLVAATAQAQTGSPNPTARTVVHSDPPLDPVEAALEAGADAVSGRPPRLLGLLMDEEVPAASRSGSGGGHRRLLQIPEGAKAAAVAAPADEDAAPAAPARMSKYKLFKTADPHRVRLVV